VQGSPARLHLRVGRWWCGNGRCARKIFTERVAKLAIAVGTTSRAFPVLERNQSNRSLPHSIQGGFFLKKKPL
jgi:hypothetical protein